MSLPCDTRCQWCCYCYCYSYAIFHSDHQTISKHCQYTTKIIIKVLSWVRIKINSKLNERITTSDHDGLGLIHRLQIGLKNVKKLFSTKYTFGECNTILNCHDEINTEYIRFSLVPPPPSPSPSLNTQQGP